VFKGLSNNNSDILKQWSGRY